MGERPRKRVCPVWLKAPGGLLRYWGTLPRFTGQEPIEKLIVRYREQYFDGERIHLVTDKIVREYSPHQSGAESESVARCDVLVRADDAEHRFTVAFDLGGADAVHVQ